MAELSMALYRILVAPRRYEQIVIVEVDPDTFGRFVASFNMRAALRKHLGRRVLVLEPKSSNFDGDPDLVKAARHIRPAQLQWVTTEIANEILTQ